MLICAIYWSYSCTDYVVVLCVIMPLLGIQYMIQIEIALLLSLIILLVATVELVLFMVLATKRSHTPTAPTSPTSPAAPSTEETPLLPPALPRRNGRSWLIVPKSPDSYTQSFPPSLDVPRVHSAECQRWQTLFAGTFHRAVPSLTPHPHCSWPPRLLTPTHSERVTRLAQRCGSLLHESRAGDRHTGAVTED